MEADVYIENLRDKSNNFVCKRRSSWRTEFVGFKIVIKSVLKIFDKFPLRNLYYLSALQIVLSQYRIIFLVVYGQSLDVILIQQQNSL